LRFAFAAANAIFISKMPEEQQPELSQPVVPQKHSSGRQRGRRGGRGRRHPRQTTVPPADETAAHATLESVEKVKAASAGADSAIAKAADEVRRIAESLEQALEQMEEVMRLVELAERQKTTDEREIEALRRTLRRIQPSS
jgi:hypothetical protein